MRQTRHPAGAPALTRRELGHIALAAWLGARSGPGALPLLKHLGVTEAARASCYVYTQTSELDRLAEALHQMTRTPTRTEDPR